MALTEEHERTARQVAKEINPDRSGDYEVIVIERFLAALPNPEPVVTIENVLRIQRLFESGNMTPNTSEDWKAALEVYTESPIAQPASAPSEQKPVAWLNPANGSVISDSHRIYLLEQYPRNKCEHVEPLYLAPQPDYKAQRDVLLEALKDMRAGWKYIRETHGDLYGVGWNRAQRKADSAIASVKGGE